MRARPPLVPALTELAARFARRHSLRVGLVAAAIACTGCPQRTSSQPAAPPPGQPSEPPVPVEPDRPEPSEPSEPIPAEPQPCAPDGRPWDGKPEDCSYEHGGCCFDSAQSACEAADCPVDRCVVLESYPAQISC